MNLKKGLSYTLSKDKVNAMEKTTCKPRRSLLISPSSRRQEVTKETVRNGTVTMERRSQRRNRSYEKASKGFSLVEVLLALTMVAMMTAAFYTSFSRSVTLTHSSRQKTKAMWLAKALMSQVEYHATFLDLKSMKYEKKNQKFPSELCPEKESPFRYNLTIQPWKLDLIGAFFKQMDPNDTGKNDQIVSEIKKQVKATLGGELLYYALVEVTWTTGIKKNSVKVPYLLTKQKELDGLVASFSQKG